MSSPEPIRRAADEKTAAPQKLLRDLAEIL
jgi:hypothetical protein